MLDEEARVGVLGGDPVYDRGSQFSHAAVGAAAQPLRGQFREPALDEVHRGVVSWGEVETESGVALLPALDLRRSVGGDVVQDDMDLEFVGHTLVDQVEEAAELAGLVTGGRVGDHMAGGDPASSAGQPIERGVEVGGSMAHVSVGLAAGHAWQHRLRRRGAVERQKVARPLRGRIRQPNLDGKPLHGEHGAQNRHAEQTVRGRRCSSSTKPPQPER